MFGAEAPSVTMFCDDGNHNKLAPTKHNFMCNGRSTLDVILKHIDFNEPQNTTDSSVIDTRPQFRYQKHQLTRYVLIIEDTSDMLIRESWSFLRMAIRKWSLFDLPENTEVGLVLANDTTASVLLKVTSLKATSSLSITSVRDRIASSIPYTPSDSRTGCLKCALEVAIQMLSEKTLNEGAASSVVLVIGPGMDYTMDMSLTSRAKVEQIRIATLNYPGVFRPQPLNELSARTGGVSYSIFEEKQNNINSHFSTYFQLTNTLYNIAETYYEGSESSLPLEIHRREISDDGRNSVTGSFMLSSELGEPARFSVFTYDSVMPLIRSIKLVSPSQVTYSTRSDSLLSMKLLTVNANINEVSFAIVLYPFAM